jgi:hypothetical protein
MGLYIGFSTILFIFLKLDACTIIFSPLGTIISDDKIYNKINKKEVIILMKINTLNRRLKLFISNLCRQIGDWISLRNKYV